MGSSSSLDARMKRSADACDLTHEELDEFDRQSLQRYRNMIGADLSAHDRAQNARKAARRIAPLQNRPWLTTP